MIMSKISVVTLIMTWACFANSTVLPNRNFYDVLIVVQCHPSNGLDRDFDDINKDPSLVREWLHYAFMPSDGLPIGPMRLALATIGVDKVQVLIKLKHGTNRLDLFYKKQEICRNRGLRSNTGYNDYFKLLKQDGDVFNIADGDRPHVPNIKIWITLVGEREVTLTHDMILRGPWEQALDAIFYCTSYATEKKAKVRLDMTMLSPEEGMRKVDGHPSFAEALFKELMNIIYDLCWLEETPSPCFYVQHQACVRNITRTTGLNKGKYTTDRAAAYCLKDEANARCPYESEYEKKCTETEAVIQWGACSVTCGSGVESGTIANVPLPEYEYCPFFIKDKLQRPCTKDPCPMITTTVNQHRPTGPEPINSTGLSAKPTGSATSCQTAQVILIVIGIMIALIAMMIEINGGNSSGRIKVYEIPWIKQLRIGNGGHAGAD